MAAWVGAFALAVTPRFDAPADRFTAYLVDHHLRLLTYGVLVEAGAALLVGFFAGLAYLHREVDRSVVPLAITGASAGVMTRVVIIAGAALAQLAVVTAHRGGDAEMVKTLFHGLGVLFAASGFPTVVTSAAIGVTMLKTALPGRWLGWLSLAVVAVHVPSVPSLAQSGVLALDGVFVYLAPALFFIVWAIATSVALIRLPADRLSQHLT
jgi:hypothetical protein